MLTAKEARKKSEQNKKYQEDREINRIIDLIDNASGIGEFSIKIEIKYSKSEVALSGLGYRLQLLTSSENHYKINW